MATNSNSSLVVYTKLSPNHSGKRTKSIDRISPHCVVGQCSVETLGEIFEPTSRQASCNYGIGSDGRIGMYVEECNRSWCTSSADNDQRAVTIECASNTTSPYEMNSSVYNSLINLCIDICKRNGKTKLIWISNKNDNLSYTPKSNEMVLTVHRWFANKSCCGDWLFNKLGDLASVVTNRLGTYSIPTQATNVIKDTPEKVIWNFFKNKKLNDYAIAGIMGNLYAESGLTASNLQNNFEKKLSMSDDEYTTAVDNKTYKNFVIDGAGYGIAQWTYWSRKQGLLDYATYSNRSIGDLVMQCEFLWKELNSTTYSKLLTQLKNASSVSEASNAFLVEFEAPANQSYTVKQTRTNYGEGYYKKNADKDKEVSLPYMVKVNDVTGLNIRKGPGTIYRIVGVIEDNGIYTITKESIGIGAKKWGKLKSGAGWISLDYCIKLS